MRPSAVNSWRQRNGRRWLWTPDEDRRLSLFVQTFGAGNWDHISRFISGRSAKSCRVRWMNQLNPEINKLPFTEEDHELLLKLHEKYGNRWSTIASFFPGRTDNQVKNRFHVLQRRGINASTASSSNANPPYDPFEGGPIDLSDFGDVLTVPPGSEFPDFFPTEDFYSGFLPGFSDMADSMPIELPPLVGSADMMPLPMTDSTGMMPFFEDGFSSTHEVGESSTMAQPSNPGWVYPSAVDDASLDVMIPHHVRAPVSSMMPTGNPAAQSQMNMVMPPELELDLDGQLFFDFLDAHFPM